MAWTVASECGQKKPYARDSFFDVERLTKLIGSVGPAYGRCIDYGSKKARFSQRCWSQRIRRACYRRQRCDGGEVVEETEDNKVMVAEKLTMEPLAARGEVRRGNDCMSLDRHRILCLQAWAQRPVSSSRGSVDGRRYDEPDLCGCHVQSQPIKAFCGEEMRQADDSFSASKTLYGIGRI